MHHIKITSLKYIYSNVNTLIARLTYVGLNVLNIVKCTHRINKKLN